MRPEQLRARLVARLRSDHTRAEFARLTGVANLEPFRTLRVSIQGFSRNNDLLWASALTYTSSLALVPILALAFSALAGVGGEDRVRPLIERYLAVDSPEITEALMGFISNTNAKALGEIGGAVLLVTVILTLGTIEQAFNSIFKVPRGRTWLRKFSDYLSVIFTVPLLVVAAVPVRVHLLRVLPHIPGAAWGISTLMIWSGYSFLYVFFPNTRVRLGAAAMGGLIAAILLQAGQWGYVHFQVGAARYQAIYGAMAAVPILLTWIYIAWIIVLYGAELTAALQGIEPAFDIDQRAPNFARIAALLVVFRAGEWMLARPGAHPCTLRKLAGELGVAESAVAPIVEDLLHGGILVEAGGSSGYFDHHPQTILLARDTGAITLAAVLGCLGHATSTARGDRRIAAILDRLAVAEGELLGSLTVTEFITGELAPSALNPAPFAPEQ
jgi:membrane protein